MVCTDSVPVPADSVTPLADHVPDPAVASTQVVPPSALTWIFSPAPSVPVKVPLTVCDATLVIKSPRRAGVGAQRRHRRNRRRPAWSAAMIAVAGARRGIAGRINGLHRQRAGAR